jgi:hypothetical protein
MFRRERDNAHAMITARKTIDGHCKRELIYHVKESALCAFKYVLECKTKECMDGIGRVADAVGRDTL